MTIDEIRQKYPQYDHMTDDELAGKLYERHYKDKMEYGDFVKSVGMEPEVPVQEEAVDNRTVPEWGRKNPELYGIAGAARETLGPLVEGAGLIMGGYAGGASGGPPGAVLGAGLAYGGAKELTKAADIALGNRPDDASMVDTAAETGGNVLTGMNLEMGGQSALPVIKGAWNSVIKPTITTGLDITTGAGPETFKRIANASYTAAKDKTLSAVDALNTVLKNMRGQEPMEIVVADAKQALQNLHQARSNEYMAGMNQVKEASKKLDFSLIDDAYKSLTDSMKIKGTWKVGSETQKKIAEINRTINEWRKNPELHTTIGFDALKQRINDLMPNKLDAGQSGRAVTSMYNAIKREIIDKSPEYAAVMRQFENSIKQTKAIERELSLGDKASELTALRKLQSIARNNVNTGYGSRVKMGEFLDEAGGSDILNKVAGQAAESLAPRGLSRLVSGGASIAGITNPAYLAALPFTSPRLMGEASVLAGKGAGALSREITPEMMKTLSQLGILNSFSTDNLPKKRALAGDSLGSLQMM